MSLNIGFNGNIVKNNNCKYNNSTKTKEINKINNDYPIDYLNSDFNKYKKLEPIYSAKKDILEIRHAITQKPEGKSAFNYVLANHKQILEDNVFYVRMNTYGRDEEWASQMKYLIYCTSMAISSGKDFGEILSFIEDEIKYINKKDIQSDLFGVKRKYIKIFPISDILRGQEYIERYLEKTKEKSTFKAKPDNEHKEANTCTISSGPSYDKQSKVVISYASTDQYQISNLELAQKEFEKLQSTENPSEEEIIKSAATIQWLIAQETPYRRGSDSIANILSKSILHAYDIEISPIKEGINLDFEAFDTDLDEYIKKYPSFFEKYPHKIS